MSDINSLICEDLQAIKNHLLKHGYKYALGSIAGALAGHQAIGAYDKFKAHRKADAGHTVLNHLAKHKETYGGAALGAASSLLSSGKSDIKHRAKSAAVSAMGGGLAGSILKNHELSKPPVQTDLK
jgi:hypothetical protein